MALSSSSFTLEDSIARIFSCEARATSPPSSGLRPPSPALCAGEGDLFYIRFTNFFRFRLVRSPLPLAGEGQGEGFPPAASYHSTPPSLLKKLQLTIHIRPFISIRRRVL